MASKPLRLPGPSPELRPSRAPLLTVPDVMARLTISRALAYELIASKQLASVRINNLVRIRPEDLEAFIVSHVQPAIGER